MFSTLQLRLQLYLFDIILFKIRIARYVELSHTYSSPSPTHCTPPPLFLSRRLYVRPEYVANDPIYSKYHKFECKFCPDANEIFCINYILFFCLSFFFLFFFLPRRRHRHPLIIFTRSCEIKERELCVPSNRDLSRTTKYILPFLFENRLLINLRKYT